MMSKAVVISSFLIFNLAHGDVFNPLCISYAKKDGAALAVGGSYDSNHFSYGLNDGAIYEYKNNQLNLLLSVYTSTYVSDLIDLGVELTVKFPRNEGSRTLSSAYKEYNDKLIAAGSAEKGAADKKSATVPYKIEINPKMSTIALFRLGYYLESVDSVLFAGVGFCLSRVKFSISGKATTNSSADVFICNREIKNTVPVMALGVMKSLGRRSGIKLQYTMQMSKTNTFNDEIHVTHNVKQKNNSISLMFVHYF